MTDFGTPNRRPYMRPYAAEVGKVFVVDRLEEPTRGIQIVVEDPDDHQHRRCGWLWFGNDDPAADRMIELLITGRPTRSLITSGRSSPEFPTNRHAVPGLWPQYPDGT